MSPTHSTVSETAADRLVRVLTDRRDVLKQFDARVDPVLLLDDVISLVRQASALLQQPVELPVKLSKAALATGYSADYLRRLVGANRIPKHGDAPLRVKISECPHKNTGAAERARALVASSSTRVRVNPANKPRAS